MADAIHFKCRSCEKKISVRAEYAGKKVKCPGCKQPLRVPIGAGTGDDAAAKSYSLSDLAEMEANADIELRELSSKAKDQSNSVRIKGGKDCPQCASSVKKEAVLCVNCGHNFDSGKQVKTQKISAFGKLFGRGKK